MGISLLALLFFPTKINTESVIKSFLPVLTTRYWYFSSYTVVFFLAPWINKLIRSLDKVQLTKLVCVLVGLFSLFTVAAYSFHSDPFTLGSGYSAIWLLALYVVGAWIKKNEVLRTLSKISLFLLLIGSYILTCGLKFLVPVLSGIILYTSPTILAMAIFFVILFSKMNLPALCNKIIKFVAPASFGVYLIHVHPFVFNDVIKDAFSWISDFSFILIPVVILGCSLIIMIGCLAIEKMRLFLFKVTRINRFISFVGCKIDGMIENFFDSNQYCKNSKK